MKNKTYTWLDIISKGAQIVTSISLLIIALVTLRINGDSFKYNFRPYVGLAITNGTQEFSSDFNYDIRILNKGNVPANNVRIFYDPKSPGLVSVVGKVGNSITQPSIIFPGQELAGTFFLNNVTQEMIQQIKDRKLEFKLHVIVTYDGIGTSSHKTEYYYSYNPERKALEIVNGKAT